MKRIATILAIATISVSAMAQGLDFLNISADPESFALAGATVARDADAFATENNVAAAALSDKKFAVAASYGMWAPDMANTNNIGFGAFYRHDKLAFTLGAKYNLHQPYDAYNQVARQLESFTPSEYSAAVGFAYSIIDHLSAGINAKFVSSTLAEGISGTAFGVDLSFMYNTESIKAGLSVNNIGSSIKYDKTAYGMPVNVRAGAAYSIAGFTASGEVDYITSAGVMAALGAEYWIADIVAVRAGYHYGNAEKTMPSFVSAGLGLKFAGVNLGAAFLFGSEPLAKTMMFSLGYAF